MGRTKMMNIAPRALLVWLGLAVVAVVNGGLREKALIPRLGEQSGHVMSTVMLATAISVITWMMLRWIGVTSSRDAWLLGILWLGLTLTFEFLAGHYLFHASWAKLLSDYNIAEGRVWALVLIATFLAPIVAFRFQRQ